MSYGMRIWDASGNLTLDTTDRLTRFVTSITPGTIGPSVTVSYYVPGIADDGTWFWILYNSFRSSNTDTRAFIRMTIVPDYIQLLNTNGSVAWTNNLNSRLEILRG
jgi:hypothetical protein